MKIRWGVVGCGGIAKARSIPGLLRAENAELVAVQDLNAAFAEEAKSAFGAKYAFTSLEEMLSLSEIDAVYIATPLFCHKEQVLAAARHKKHVLCEKPLGLNSIEVEEMIAACKHAEVKFGTAFMARFHNFHVKMKELVAAGAIGEILSIKAQWSFHYKKVENAWRQDKKRGGGGAFMDVGTHCIDLVRYITGLEAEEVVALTGNQRYDYTVEDYGQLLARMSNGAVLYLSSNYNMSTEPQRIEICGTKGALTALDTLNDPDHCTEVYLYTHGEGKTMLTIEGERNNMYTCEFAAFSEAILQGLPLPVPAEEGLAAQRIIDAAYASEADAVRVRVKK